MGDGLKKLKQRNRQQLAQVFRPTPRLSGSEWANLYRYLPVETATEPGPYRWERAPYQREWMDTMCDNKTQKIVLMTAARVGKTVCLLNTTGFFMHQNPAALMWLLPTLGEAEKFSVSEIDPMIRDSRVLRDLIQNRRVRDSGNLKLRKAYKGGSLSLVGGESATQLHGKTIRVLLADECDRFPMSAGKDGDPLTLAMVRTTTFGHRKKIVLSSTPTYKDISVIEREFLLSDQRYYHVPCPHCGHYQKLQWKQLSFADDPENPEYVCEECAACISENQKFNMLRAGRWVAENPESKTAGFHINALYSVYMSWKDLVEEWQQAKGNRFKLQVFINSRLAETWDESGDRATVHQLEQRLEHYDAQVPTGVGIVSAGVDVQGNRLEVAVYGHGANDEIWLIDTEIFGGDTGLDAVWNKLGEFLLNKRYTTKNGGLVGIRAIAVDSGFNTERVYRFVQHLNRIDSAGRTIIATKGVDRYNRFVADRPNQSRTHNALYYQIGTNIAKEHLQKIMGNSTVGAQYLHLPISLPGEEKRWLDKEVLAQLTSEKQVVSYKNGKVRREWRKVRDRNEQWDMLILAYAALLHLGPNILSDVGKLAERVAELTSDAAQPPKTEAGDSSTVKNRMRQSGLVLHSSGRNQSFWKR